MKSLSETVKESELRKRQLQEQIDQLNEECAKLAAQGTIQGCHFLWKIWISWGIQKTIREK